MLNEDEQEYLRQLALAAEDEETLSTLESLLGLATESEPSEPEAGGERWTVATLADVAQFFDVSHDTVRKNWRPSGMPGAEGAYNLRAIRRWKDTRTRDETAGGGQAKHEKLLADVEHAREKVKMAKLERQTREGSLIDRNRVHDDFGELAAIFRRIGEQLQRRHGEEARSILQEGLDEFERYILTKYGPTEN